MGSLRLVAERVLELKNIIIKLDDEIELSYGDKDGTEIRKGLRDRKSSAISMQRFNGNMLSFIKDEQ